MITGDKKEDWSNNGLPRPEMIEEASAAGIPLYWTFFSDDFMRSAVQYLPDYEAKTADPDPIETYFELLPHLNRAMNSANVSTRTNGFRPPQTVPASWSTCQ